LADDSQLLVFMQLTNRQKSCKSRSKSFDQVRFNSTQRDAGALGVDISKSKATLR